VCVRPPRSTYAKYQRRSSQTRPDHQTRREADQEKQIRPDQAGEERREADHNRREERREERSRPGRREEKQIKL